jgi:hypothetical protein
MESVGKQARPAIAATLTSIAVGVRHAAIERIATTMITRQFGFASAHLRYTPATPTTLWSQAGSTEGPRFSGFLEQEKGGPMRLRDRVITLAARGKDPRRVVAPSARLKPGNVFLKPDSYLAPQPARIASQSIAQKARGMIRSLSRKGYRKPFVIFGHAKLPAGLYTLQGARDHQKIVMLQEFEKRVHVTQKPWMRPAVDLFFKRWDSHREWDYQLGRRIRKALKKI